MRKRGSFPQETACYSGIGMAGVTTLLLERLNNRSATVGVIGLGYVGLPLLVEFAKAGFSAIGFDVDGARVERIGRGESDIPDVSTEELAAAVDAGRLVATGDFQKLAEVDTVNICVPTPLRKTKDPDLSFVAAATESVSAHLHPGQLIILESTPYRGTPEEVVQPLLERSGLKVGQDFFLAFSPERVDPGNSEWRTANIPKVVGGVDSASTEVAAALYRQIVKTVVPVSSTRVAEMVKLLENTFRAVNIGLVNELALMCRDLEVNVWEVIDAAKTKPFGFMPFYPGPGLGGHCIPIDPFYLSWKARQNGFESRFIELAGHINGRMPRYVLERVSDALNTVGKPLKGAAIHLFGVAYKANVGDVRESPALDLAQLLQERGAKLSYSDPYVASLELGQVHLEAIEPSETFDQEFDCAVITTPHSSFDYDEIVRRSPLIVDTRNALRGRTDLHIVRL